ncbi:MAG TPA: RloB family protein [Chlorobiota bacterium]|nr:RloB family protein [Chlorobiota bacterium]
MPKYSFTSELKKKVLIVCEGETEVMYFDQLYRMDGFKRKYVYEIRVARDNSPLGVVRETIDRKRRGRGIDKIDIAWAVFDRDRHPNLSDAFSEASNADVNIAFSSICFEYWVLLHHVNTTALYNECDRVISEVVTHQPTYRKNDRRSIATLLMKLEVALSNAEVIERNSRLEKQRLFERAVYTDVHKLVHFMRDDPAE